MESSSKKKIANADSPIVLLVEDDPEQMAYLAQLCLGEIQQLIDDVNLSETQKSKLRSIKILKVSNIDSLEKTVSLYKEVLMTIMDCNIPDKKGGNANDQFVKSNYRITGQHRAVDIVKEALPSAPITLISSMNRFRTMVNQFYKDKHDLQLKFISKNNSEKIQNNISRNLHLFIQNQV